MKKNHTSQHIGSYKLNKQQLSGERLKKHSKSNLPKIRLWSYA